MTGAEQGFLLLTSHMGDPLRRPLTVAQFRELAKRASTMQKPVTDGELTAEDLLKLGCSREFAGRVLQLLSQEEQLQWYLEKGRRYGCVPLTRMDEAYPKRVLQMLGWEAPGVLWAKGDLSLLKKPTISLVGSRELLPENRSFAREVGRLCAQRGICIVSGNARGADTEAQEACLAAGGQVISIVADSLKKHPAKEKVLYLSEEGYDLPFTAVRALSRNRVIHTASAQVFVAQCSYQKGGTWDGTVKNLQYGWSDVYCFRDASLSCRELSQRGAIPVNREELPTILLSDSPNPNFLNT